MEGQKTYFTRHLAKPAICAAVTWTGAVVMAGSELPAALLRAGEMLQNGLTIFTLEITAAAAAGTSVAAG